MEKTPAKESPGQAVPSFIEGAEQEAPTNDELASISQLAKRMIDILGTGEKGPIAKGPSGDAIQGLRDWAKGKVSDPLPNLLEYSISELVSALVERLKEYRKISEESLPEAMMIAGNLEMFKLAGGFVIEVKSDIASSIKANQEEGAFAWIEEKGFGDVIKDRVECTLNHGDNKKAQQLLLLANKLGVPAIEKKSIHAATLKSLIVEQRKKGVQFPTDFFNIFDLKKAVVKINK